MGTGKSTISEGLRLPEGYTFFSIAGAHAALAGLAGQEGTGVSAVEGMAHADQAMALLRKAVDTGFRKIRAYRTKGVRIPNGRGEELGEASARFQIPDRSHLSWRSSRSLSEN